MAPKCGMTGKEFATNCLFGIQHTFAMMGSNILVPLITGMNPSMALISAGVGTIIFHFTTKRMVPVFLGSSFAFIDSINSISKYGAEKGWNHSEVMGAQMVGIIFTGIVYFILSAITYFVGPRRIQMLFPPVVIGPIILVIGMILAPTVIGSNIVQQYDGSNATMPAYKAWITAIFTALIMICISIFARGIWKSLPVLFGIVGGYAISACFQIIDYQKIVDTPWIIFEPDAFLDAFGYYAKIRWDWNCVVSLFPLAIVTFMEHLGDITTNGAVVGKDFFADPGLHRTLLGDGIALCTAAFLGGPPVTTYGENTGVLAITKNYNPILMVFAAVFAIILGIISKFGGVLSSIPSPVIGGASMVLFGMISSMGIKVLVDHRVDFTQTRNMMIAAMILVIGLGFNGGGVKIVIGTVSISALAVCTLVGIILNVLLPTNLTWLCCSCDKKNPEKEDESDISCEDIPDGENPNDINASVDNDQIEPIQVSTSESTEDNSKENSSTSDDDEATEPSGPTEL